MYSVFLLQILMSSIASMLWLDVEDRLKKYENELQQNIKVNEKMKDNWNAIKLLFAYLDEGVLGTDAQLASSLWSIMYSSNTRTFFYLLFYYRLHMHSMLVFHTFFHSCRNVTGYSRRGKTAARGVSRLDDARRRPGQETSLAPPCSKLRSFGSKCTVLKKALATLLGLFCAPQ